MHNKPVLFEVAVATFQMTHAFITFINFFSLIFSFQNIIWRIINLNTDSFWCIYSSSMIRLWSSSFIVLIAILSLNSPITVFRMNG